MDISETGLLLDFFCLYTKNKVKLSRVPENPLSVL